MGVFCRDTVVNAARCVRSVALQDFSASPVDSFGYNGIG
jgi:hypothetical protein